MAIPQEARHRIDIGRHLFHSTNGSAFCPETMTLFTKDTVKRKDSTTTVSPQDYETVHETFHWATSCFTTAGLLLSFVRYARLKMIIDFIARVGSEKINENLGTPRGEFLPAMKFADLATVVDPENDTISPEVCNVGILHTFERMFLFGSDTLAHFRGGPSHFQPVQIAVRTIDLLFTEYERHRSGSLPQEALSDKDLEEIGSALATQFGFAVSGKNRHAVNTIDLFEAFSVVADICAAMSTGDQNSAEARMRMIKGTHYITALEAILTRLDLPVTQETIWEYWPTLFVILEIALNPPCLPVVDIRTYKSSWANFYPPLRSIFATNVAKNINQLVTRQSPATDVESFFRLVASQLDARPFDHSLPLQRRSASFFSTFGTDQTRTRIQGRWDWFDVLIELFENFHGETGYPRGQSISAAMAGENYLKFERAYPPVIILNDGELGYQSPARRTLAEQWLILMGTWFGLEDIAQGSRHVCLSPFRSDVTKQKDWYRRACLGAEQQIRSGLGLTVAFN